MQTPLRHLEKNHCLWIAEACQFSASLTVFVLVWERKEEKGEKKRKRLIMEEKQLRETHRNNMSCSDCISRQTVLGLCSAKREKKAMQMCGESDAHTHLSHTRINRSIHPGTGGRMVSLFRREGLHLGRS